MECGNFWGWPFGYSWCSQKNPERGIFKFWCVHFLFKVSMRFHSFMCMQIFGLSPPKNISCYQAIYEPSKGNSTLMSFSSFVFLRHEPPGWNFHIVIEDVMVYIGKMGQGNCICIRKQCCVASLKISQNDGTYYGTYNALLTYDHYATIISDFNLHIIKSITLPVARITWSWNLGLPTSFSCHLCACALWAMYATSLSTKDWKPLLVQTIQLESYIYGEWIRDLSIYTCSLLKTIVS